MKDTAQLLSKRGLEIVTRAMREERKMWRHPASVYLDALYVCLLLRLKGELNVLGHRDIPLEYEI